MITPINVYNVANSSLPDVSRTSVGRLFNEMAAKSFNAFESKIASSTQPIGDDTDYKPVDVSSPDKSGYMNRSRTINIANNLSPSANRSSVPNQPQSLGEPVQDVLPTVEDPFGQEPGSVLPPKGSIPEESTQLSPDAPPAEKSYGDLGGLVRDFEGFSAKAYADYKGYSIGYGTPANSPDEVITEAEARRRSDERLSATRASVENIVKKYGYKFNPSQVDALTSFQFNAGRLDQLTDNGRRSPEEIARMLPEYRRAGGKVQPGLVKRRLREREIFTRGY